MDLPDYGGVRNYGAVAGLLGCFGFHILHPQDVAPTRVTAELAVGSIGAPVYACADCLHLRVRLVAGHSGFVPAWSPIRRVGPGRVHGV